MADNNMIKRNQNPVTIWDLFSRPLASFADFSPLASMDDDFKVDIQDNGQNYSLKADLPGVQKEDLKVDFADGILTISAEHHSSKEDKDEKGYLLRERVSGSYSRSFSFAPSATAIPSSGSLEESKAIRRPPAA